MRRLINLILVLAIVGCNPGVEVTPRDEFVKIYDDDDFNERYEPIDVIQTSDDGYLVLSFYKREDSNFRGLYVLKADAEGEFASGTKFINDFVSPVKPLMQQGDRYYFFCMDQFSLGVRLIEMDADGNVINAHTVGTTYPLAAGTDGQNFVLQSYDHVNKRTVLSTVDVTGAIQQSSDFDIGAGDGVEEPIIDHFNQTGRYLPFLAGRASDGAYYFNGFYNFTLSLVFSDLGGSQPTGVCQGQQDEGGLNAVMATGANRFAVGRFNFGDNFIHPDAAIPTNSITSSVDLIGNPYPELVSNTHVEVAEHQINGKSVIIFGSSTNSGQIILMGYDPTTFELKGQLYLGFANPYQFGGFAATADEGLVVVGKTFVGGRFQRPCLFKITRDQTWQLAN